MQPTSNPAHELMLRLHGHWPQMIAVAAKFQFADHLATGPKTAAELAQLTGTHESSVYRFLRVLAGVGIFADDGAGRFSNTPQSELLREGQPGSMRAAAFFTSHEAIVTTWGDLAYSLKTGKPAFEHIYHKGFWEYSGRHPELASIFNDSMTSFTSAVAAGVLGAYDFDGIGTLCDVAGGHGFLLASILGRYPAMKGVLFEQPHLLPMAGAALQAHEVAGRCELVGGSFFESVPPADAYVLKSIIHDWSDEDAVRILRSVQRASKPGQKLLIVESVIAPDDPADLAKLVDLVMLLFTPGGRERTEQEYGALLDAAGFDLVRVVPTRSPASIIESRRR